MKDHSDNVRGFVWSSRAYYANSASCHDEINFGMYSREGGTSGEMCMKWIVLSLEKVPCLEVFSDSWSALFLFQDVLKKLSERDGDRISQEEFVEILKSCNFEDFTKYTNPYGKKNREALLAELQQAEAKIRDLKRKLADSPQ